MPIAQPDYALKLKTLTEKKHVGVLHNANYLQGLVFAVCAAPEIPMPEVWLNWSFKQHGKIPSMQEADEIAEVLMGLLQEQLKAMRSERFDYPGQGQPLPDDATPDMHCSQWLQGLLAGHTHLESLWQSCWQNVQESEPGKVERYQRDLKHCLMMFSTFADVPLAKQQAQRVGNNKLIDSLPDIYLSLPKALKTYVDLAGQLASYLPEQFETFKQPTN